MVALNFNPSRRQADLLSSAWSTEQVSGQSERATQKNPVSEKKIHKANSSYYSLKSSFKGRPTVTYTALEYTFSDYIGSSMTTDGS